MAYISSNTDAGNANGYVFTELNSSLTILNGVLLQTNSGYSGILSKNDGNGGNNHIVNAGIINAGAGVYFSQTSSNSLVNTSTGVISAYNGVFDSGSNNTISNNGMIDATFTAISESGSRNNYIYNQGSLSGAYEGILGANAMGLVIDNLGTISGGDYAIEAYGGDKVVVRNSGTISGDVELRQTATNRLINTGHILGDVSFDAGASVYDGRDGTLTGSVTGGTGADRIYAGNDGETLGGGKGHDRLVAGGGADTFVISSFSAADTDVIKRFNVSQDLIQLDHTVFTHLKADATPAFTVGTAASSPTDFLFYNSGTGGLFYDVDGNGAARSPYLLATLDKGLKLTASNFDVV